MLIYKDDLTIRNAVPSDAKQLCIWWNDGKIMEHAGFPNGLVISVEDIENDLAGDTDEKSRRHVIELAGKPIGEMNYRNKGYGVAEIGIKICDFSVHEKGLGTALLSMFIDALFNNYGFTKIILDTNTKNERAQHVYENKLGFKKQRINVNSRYDQSGEPQSSIDYEMTKENWQALREKAPISYQIDRFYNDRFPLSNKYDFTWICKNEMGPHPLWLTEFLVQSFDLKPGKRVLDLACGKGMTSVFLAREFGVQVYAVDFDEWGDLTSTEIRWNNAKEYSVDNLVVPIKADARSLPFAHAFFDAIVCVDAYIYFGQDEVYLQNILKFLKPGGKIGMIVPGYMKETKDGVPGHIVDFLGDELWTWQTLPWWQNLWERDTDISLDVADTLPDGCDLWLRYDTALNSSGMNMWPDETDLQRQDNGEYVGFIRMVATKKHKDGCMCVTGE